MRLWFGYVAGAGSSAPTRFKTSYASEARASPASGFGGRTAAFSMTPMYFRMYLCRRGGGAMARGRRGVRAWTDSTGAGCMLVLPRGELGEEVGAEDGAGVDAEAVAVG